MAGAQVTAFGRPPDISVAVRGVRVDRWHVARIGRWRLSIHRLEAAPGATVWDDHRWDSLSLVLWGRLDEAWLDRCGRVRRAALFPGRVRRRRAETRHRLSGSRAWTLIATGPARRRSRYCPDGPNGPWIEFDQPEIAA